MDNLYCKRVIGANNIYEMIRNSTRKYVIKELNTWNMTYIYTNEEDCEKLDEVIFNFIKLLPYNDNNSNHIEISCNSYVSPHNNIWVNYLWITTYQLEQLLKLINNTTYKLDYCQKCK